MSTLVAYGDEEIGRVVSIQYMAWISRWWLPEWSLGVLVLVWLLRSLLCISIVRVSCSSSCQSTSTQSCCS